ETFVERHSQKMEISYKYAPAGKRGWVKGWPHPPLTSYGRGRGGTTEGGAEAQNRMHTSSSYIPSQQYLIILVGLVVHLRKYSQSPSCRIGTAGRDPTHQGPQFQWNRGWDCGRDKRAAAGEKVEGTG